MDKQKAQEILKSAKNDFDGDLNLAIAAEIYTPGVIAKCGGMPAFADKRAIGRMKGKISQLTAPAKKPAAAKTAEKPAAETTTPGAAADQTTAAPKPKTKTKKAKGKKANEQSN